ncbi:translation initiation factor IF-2-like [Lutra lutra]|uniref:translation initiation factor IF-2-like n=1 Tax=Lutra lutra TaxID=9657 RepID=UPI001FD0C3C0|nr:translation initiation factor IF-2-like [Lutra lutra]
MSPRAAPAARPAPGAPRRPWPLHAPRPRGRRRRRHSCASRPLGRTLRPRPPGDVRALHPTPRTSGPRRGPAPSPAPSPAPMPQGRRERARLTRPLTAARSRLPRPNPAPRPSERTRARLPRPGSVSGPSRPQEQLQLFNSAAIFRAADFPACLALGKGRAGGGASREAGRRGRQQGGGQERRRGSAGPCEAPSETSPRQRPSLRLRGRRRCGHNDAWALSEHTWPLSSAWDNRPFTAESGRAAGLPASCRQESAATATVSPPAARPVRACGQLDGGPVLVSTSVLQRWSCAGAQRVTSGSGRTRSCSAGRSPALGALTRRRVAQHRRAEPTEPLGGGAAGKGFAAWLREVLGGHLQSPRPPRCPPPRTEPSSFQLQRAPASRPQGRAP